MKILLHGLLLCLTVAFALPARADQVFEATAIGTDLTAAPGSGGIAAVAGQAGLSSANKYASGVDDFDTYFSTSRPRDSSNPANTFLSTSFTNFTGYIDFDLGSLRTVNQIAIWNLGDGVPYAMTSFELAGSVDGTFDSNSPILIPATLGFASAGGPPESVEAQIISVNESAEVRYLRLTITGNDQSDESAVGLGGIAFGVAAIPEPRSWAMLCVVSMVGGTWFYRRRRLQKT